MRRKAGTDKPTAEQVVKDIRRKTRKHHSAEKKIRIVLEGLRGEESIAALCRHEGIATSPYYSWSKEFLEAGNKRLAGDTARQATSPEVKELWAEASALKEAITNLALETAYSKKVCSVMGTTTYEIPRNGEARDHPTCRAVPLANEDDAVEAEHFENQVLPLVCPL